MSISKPKTFKWSLDFTKSKHEKSTETVSPPGYSHSASSTNIEITKNDKPNRLIIKKSWDLALDPLKQIPMNLFIMYMTGTSISIFPIMMIGMLIVRPVKILYNINKTFKNIEGTRAWGQKFIFIIGNVINIILAMYKYHIMGLLPLHESDWLAFIEKPTRMEYSGGGMSFS